MCRSPSGVAGLGVLGPEWSCGRIPTPTGLEHESYKIRGGGERFQRHLNGSQWQAAEPIGPELHEILEGCQHLGGPESFGPGRERLKISRAVGMVVGKAPEARQLNAGLDERAAKGCRISDAAKGRHPPIAKRIEGRGPPPWPCGWRWGGVRFPTRPRAGRPGHNSPRF